MSKPVWLLDVDGVINACPWDGEFPTTHPDDTWKLIQQPAQGRLWPIRYSTVVIERLTKLSERVEIRWHTTWQEWALGLGEALGLPEFPVQVATMRHSYMHDPSEYLWWKMKAGMDVLRLEKRPLIWTDDDLDYEWRTLAEREAEKQDLPICLVTPSLDCGLTMTELNKIEYFIEDCEYIASKGAGAVGS